MKIPNLMKPVRAQIEWTIERLSTGDIPELETEATKKLSKQDGEAKSVIEHASDGRTQFQLTATRLTAASLRFTAQVKQDGKPYQESFEVNKSQMTASVENLLLPPLHASGLKRPATPSDDAIAAEEQARRLGPASSGMDDVEKRVGSPHESVGEQLSSGSHGPQAPLSLHGDAPGPHPYPGEIDTTSFFSGSEEPEGPRPLSSLNGKDRATNDLEPVLGR